MGVGKIGFFLSVIVMSVAVTSLIVNVYLFDVVTQLNDELSELQKVEFQTIDKGETSGHENSVYYVIENESAWTVIWNQHQSYRMTPPPQPKIDFSKNIVIAVFMGWCHGLGNHEIEVKEILNTPQCVIVKVEKTHFTGGYWPAASQPYHIVKMERIGKEITFETVERTTERS